MTNSKKDPSSNPSSPSQPSSPSANPSPAPTSPPPSPSPQTLQLEQQLQQQQSQIAVLSQMLWNLVRTYEPEEQQTVVSCEASDELWQLAFLPSDAKDSNPTEQRILAGTIPPLTDSEQKRVVRYLRGTDKDMHEALTALALPHPSPYVTRKIAPFLRWAKSPSTGAGYWESASAPGIVERAKNALGLSKS